MSILSSILGFTNRGGRATLIELPKTVAAPDKRLICYRGKQM